MPAVDEPSPAATTAANVAADKQTKSTETKAQPPTQPAGGEKLSNAELKARAKAEKAAKRAQNKADAGVAPKQPPAQTQEKPPRPPKQPQNQKQSTEPHTTNTATAKPPSKSQPNQAKNMPHRPAHAAEKTHPEPVPKENKNVALFGHLYTQPRRTTIAGAPKDVHPDILALGQQMSNYVITGSSARCVATLLAFKRLIESYTTPPGTSLPRNLTALLSPQIEYLVSCRPLSISTGNAIRWLKLLINDVDIETPEEKAKQDLCDAIDSFIRERITIADQVIATTACSKIQNGDTILTYAKSNVVLKALLQAHASGVKFKVIVIDSRPLFEGKNLARSLVAEGLSVQYSLTHAAAHLMNDVTKVFLGAHGMFSNGRLYSRIGTAIIAMTAHALAKPVIVCCESIKFSDRVALDSIVLNEILPSNELLLPKQIGENGIVKDQSLAGWKDLPNLQILDLMYDVTPAHMIDMVITEYGSLPPSSVGTIHRLSSSM